MLSDRERFKIAQIDGAIARIASRRYGLCETCELEITQERLNAMPFTWLCCDCRQEQEDKAKTRRRYVQSDDQSSILSSVYSDEESIINQLMGSENESVLGQVRSKVGQRD